MAGTPPDVAWAAKRALDQGSPEYLELSAKMCWDAVIQCARHGGVNVKRSGEALIDQKAHPLTKAAMDLLPPGRVIGFFDGAQLIHAMISTDPRSAAGNKNNCVGVGSAVGWEQLDLVSGLKWNGDGNSITAPGLTTPTRTVTVYYQTVTDL